MELSPHFSATEVAHKWSQLWSREGFFSSIPDPTRPAFSIVMPPPNITGILHLGHCLNITVQDILCRRARAEGKNVCWAPGVDHASIATEAKVWERLKKTKNINKGDIDRATFLAAVEQWKGESISVIRAQIERLGASVDWSRFTFTMDAHYVQAVQQTFIDLYEKGWIYKGERMVNWDCAAKTVISDEEVVHEQVDAHLYYVKYPLVGEENKYVIVATTRPETILGDVALCVHPDDVRHANLHHKKVYVPLVNREIPIITDSYVEPTFGTGVLKITPAHDVNDYEIGLRHKLDSLDILTDDGHIIADAPVLAGMERFAARKEMARLLTQENLLEKQEPYKTSVGFSQRTNAVVESKISTQWFVNTSTLAREALSIITDGETKIFPEGRFLNTYKRWLENPRDWCISRQLWWGQRVPVYYAKKDTTKYVAALHEQDALKKFHTKHNLQLGIEDIFQDEDCLDTWFSSWLWPLEVFKGVTDPGNADIRYYYPTDTIVTGQDIIFFWIARMAMAGKYYTQKTPFRRMYFTGMVRDKEGRKMSKSLGNSPDMLALIDTYGADVLRFSVMISTPAGNDLLFDESALVQGRNFINKLWNALRLITSWRTQKMDPLQAVSPARTFANKWIRARLTQVQKEVESSYDTFRLSEALKQLYTFLWTDFCATYIEWIKPRAGEQIDEKSVLCAREIFTQALTLLHPFMPFATEEITQLLYEKKDAPAPLAAPRTSSIAAALSPDDMLTIARGERAQMLISALRELRTRRAVTQNIVLDIAITSKDDSAFYLSIASLLQNMAGVRIVDETADKNRDHEILLITTDSVCVFLPALSEADKQAEVDKLASERERLVGFLAGVEKKLSNPRFMQNAQAHFVANEQKKKTDAQEKIKTIDVRLAQLKG